MANLIEALDGNNEKANAILTIAMYKVSNGGSFYRIYHWQRIEKELYPKPIIASFITTLTQSITKANRMSMFRLRAARVRRVVTLYGNYSGVYSLHFSMRLK